MIEAFRNAPRCGVEPPGAQGLAQTAHERVGVFLYRIEAVLQHCDVLWIAVLHTVPLRVLSIPYGTERYVVNTLRYGENPCYGK
jgi:hypothetical protein